MKKKVNPRRIPVTMADVERAKEQATKEAMRRLLYLMLYIDIDNHGMPKHEVQKRAEEVNYYCESIIEGRITWKDIEHVVRDEYEVKLPW